MSAIDDLKACASRKDLAVLLGFKPAMLSYILYVNRADGRYRTFDIPKRSGGRRNIAAPPNDLALVQKRLSNLLQDCLDSFGAGHPQPRDQFSHGFRRGRSIITNADMHTDRRYVFNTDIVDFFGSINFGRVRGYFLKDDRFALSEEVATALAHIACYNNQLPQGSPCSPVIANLIAHILDVRLVKLAKRTGCIYSRYADDLTFSTNKRSFPTDLAEQTHSHDWTVGPELLHLVKQCGFDLSPSKTRMQYRDSRQEVTGLTVNKRISVRNEYAHTVRAMVHRLIRTGSFEFVQSSIDPAGTVTVERRPGNARQLQGMLSFIEWIDAWNRRKKRENANETEKPQDGFTRREKVYKTFLHFNELFSASRPLIICEGKTDNIYLLHAIRALATSFPALATVVPGGSIDLIARLFKYTDRSIGRILGIHGGTGHLVKLIGEYHAEAAQFTAPGLKHPVVIVVDNDDGSRGIFDKAGKLTGHAVPRSVEFFHVTQNLYVVPTPRGPKGEPTAIEDSFDAATKATRVDGKEFDPNNDFNPTTHYGKTAFAYKVVQPNAGTIDFSGFAPLLSRIDAVVKEHARRVAGSK
jgi:RNA-directed DNA polymerase